jgi:hypothetical protein
MGPMNARRETRLGLLGTAVLFGSLWGLAEAVLGHVLHLARVPGLPGLVMVPLAVAIMGRAAVRSCRAGAVLLAGVVAASFKLFDLLVPGTDLTALARPVQAILLEALGGAIWTGILVRTRGTVPFRGQAPAGRP